MHATCQLSQCLLMSVDMVSALMSHQLLFKQACLSIGAVQNGHVSPLMFALPMQHLDEVHHSLCFVPLIVDLLHLSRYTVCHNIARCISVHADVPKTCAEQALGGSGHQTPMYAA